MGKIEQDDQDFDFIKEKIKDKPVNRRRLLFQGLWTAILAMIFGTVACFVFVLLEPVISDLIYPKKNPTVIIPEDEESSVEEEKEKQENENTAKEEEQEETLPIPVIQELEVEDFQALQNKLYAIGKSANKAVVTVTGVKNLNIFHNTYEDTHQTSGVIILNNGQELLILTNKNGIEDVDEINITFINEDIVPGKMKKYDGNTGIAIVAVSLGDISEETMNQIEVAQMGNSLSVSQGTVVMAIGSPLGLNYSILHGTVTSSGNSVSTLDRNYKIFTTNINRSTQGNGVLINLNGEIVGVIMQKYENEIDQSTISAFSISGLKSMIEALSNKKAISYLGLKLRTVTNEIEQEHGIPKGIYISFVELDSPAMKSGLQEADVIIQLNGADVLTEENYTEVLMSMKPGEELTVTVLRQNGESYTELHCPAVLEELQ